MTREEINDAIKNRKLCTYVDDSTYVNLSGYKFASEYQDDPDMLFMLKIMFVYAPKYKWNTEEAKQFIRDNLADSRGYYIGSDWYLYDWGMGENKVTNDWLHFPHLDHIDAKAKGGTNKPENMRIVSHNINQCKNVITEDVERYAVIVDNFKALSDERKQAIIKELKEYC